MAEDRITSARRVAGELAGLVAATRDESRSLSEALTDHPTLLDIMGADGAVVRAQDRTSCKTDLDALIAQVRNPGSDDDATAVVLRRH